MFIDIASFDMLKAFGEINWSDSETFKTFSSLYYEKYI